MNLSRTLASLTLAVGAYLTAANVGGAVAPAGPALAPAAPLAACASTITTTDTATGAVIARTCDAPAPTVVLIPALVCDRAGCHER